MQNARLTAPEKKRDADAYATKYGCIFVPGDANHSGVTNGVDVTFMVNYFQLGSNPPPYICECPSGTALYAEGDANGTCQFNGVDVTYLQNWLRGRGRTRSLAPIVNKR